MPKPNEHENLARRLVRINNRANALTQLGWSVTDDGEAWTIKHAESGAEFTKGTRVQVLEAAEEVESQTVERHIGEAFVGVVSKDDGQTYLYRKGVDALPFENLYRLRMWALDQTDMRMQEVEAPADEVALDAVMTFDPFAKTIPWAPAVHVLDADDIEALGIEEHQLPAEPLRIMHPAQIMRPTQEQQNHDFHQKHPRYPYPVTADEFATAMAQPFVTPAAPVPDPVPTAPVEPTPEEGEKADGGPGGEVRERRPRERRKMLEMRACAWRVAIEKPSKIIGQMMMDGAVELSGDGTFDLSCAALERYLPDLVKGWEPGMRVVAVRLTPPRMVVGIALPDTTIEADDDVG